MGGPEQPGGKENREAVKTAKSEKQENELFLLEYARI
jgi:hypothetical protein